MNCIRDVCERQVRERSFVLRVSRKTVVALAQAVAQIDVGNMFFLKDKHAVVPDASKNNKAILRRTRPLATNVGALIIIATVDDAEILLQGTPGIAASANPHFDHGVAVVVVTTVDHKLVADTLIAVAIAYVV